ncbi:hypothetical protein C0Q44_19655 [Paenibacillus sp. PCH8]|uniref:AraC family transcriptional regulator n=1 Tax=Paenibacillus sp. PCH8 TaxID=2066524 RepID=UPI000CF9E9FE|nr:AraC family transcriptional regulator [Paenibacillus sp. PCH8]PQP81887.1 hypothetical protein C0Q44_19655 [Paenibacillus sp. PCH8]
MNPSVQRMKSETFLNNHLQLFVNRCSEDFVLPFHTHDFVEYSYVAEGKGFHHVAEDVIPVTKGMLFVIPVGVPHVFRPASTNTNENPLIIYNCLFDTVLINRLTATIQEKEIIQHLMNLEQNQVPYISVVDHNNQIEELMLKLYREFSVPGIGSSTMLYMLATQLVLTTYRHLYQDVQDKQSHSTDFEFILRYLKQHVSNRVQMSDLVRVSGWSEKQIARMFLRHTGQTFSNHLQHLRVQKSCELLKSSQHKVSLIAELVGYRDMDSFYAVFKKITGETPLLYRKKSRAQHSGF